MLIFFTVQSAAVGRIVMPASFTGGTCYIVAKVNDAMTNVRELGAGDLFINATCNPLWPEITDNIQRLYPGKKSTYHPEIVPQVFWLKLRGLIHLLRNGASQQCAGVHLLNRVAETRPATPRPYRALAGAGG